MGLRANGHTIKYQRSESFSIACNKGTLHVLHVIFIMIMVIVNFFLSRHCLITDCDYVKCVDVNSNLFVTAEL
jgi:hypothetical protein